MNRDRATSLVVLAAASFSQHAPVLFLLIVVPASLRAEGVSLTIIGLMSFAVLPFVLQFLWAPLVERHRFPGMDRWKGWLVATQLAGVLGVTVLIVVRPQAGNWLFFLIVLMLLAVASGTQKIAAGGFALQRFSGGDRSLAIAAQGLGAAGGTLFGTLGLTALLDARNWQAAVGACAAAMLFIALLMLLLVRPLPSPVEVDAPTPRLRFRDWIRRFHHPRFRTIARQGMLVAVPVGLCFGQLQTRLVDAGFDVGAIGLINGLAQLFVWLALGPLIAWAIRNYSTGLVLVVALAVAALATGTIALLSMASIIPVAAAAIAAAAIGLGGLVGCTMTISNVFMNEARPEQGATDLALFISLYGVVLLLAAGLSGVLAEAAGYDVVLAVSGTISLGAAMYLGGHRRFTSSN